MNTNSNNDDSFSINQEFEESSEIAESEDDAISLGKMQIKRNKVNLQNQKSF